MFPFTGQNKKTAEISASLFLLFHLNETFFTLTFGKSMLHCFRTKGITNFGK